MTSGSTIQLTNNNSAAKDWLRALQLTAAISRNPQRILPIAINETAEQFADSPALLSDRECFTNQQLAERSSQYARWSLRRKLRKGDVVGLLMTNRPEYFALWLGLTSAGCVVALLNTNLVGPSLAHCINVVQPKHLIVAAEYIDSLTGAMPTITVSPTIWTHGSDDLRFARMDFDVLEQPHQSLTAAERPALTVEDPALYIFTSGTTGLPKAATVSHARILQWTHWFAGLMNAQRSDRLYCCLPMYHSVGGVLVPGAALAAGGSVVIRESFSASQFWNDVIRWDCTIFQYIGEVCRYLLHTAPTANETRHRVRLVCGNGFPPDLWDKFKERFQIPRILEFYGSTEGGVSLFNVEGERGAIGRVPPYLRHRFSPVLVRLDPHTGDPLRDEQGFCIRCEANEPGEAIGKVVTDPASIGNRFEGYTDQHASEKKILSDVFEPKDAWVRTGDLMKQDSRGFFYFVDRIGDTFRWKGENVAATEVSEAICEFPGVRQAAVYGVAVPASEGRAGMAAIVVDHAIDLLAFRAHLVDRLPSYARPLFLRLRNDLEITGTFKYSKTDLVRKGFNPDATTDAIYYDYPQSSTFRRLDSAVYGRIKAGQIRF